MNFKKFVRLNAGVKKIAAAAMAGVLAVGAVVIGSSMKAGAYSKTQDVLEKLLGTAKPYGVVAEEFTNNNHNQTNFAVNMLHSTANYYSWSVFNKSMGTTYIRNIDDTSLMQIDKETFDNLVLGFNYDYRPDESKIYALEGDSLSNRTGAVINIANCRDFIKIYYAPDYMDVTAARQKVAETFRKYAAISDDEADIVIDNADNKIKIDLASKKDKQIVVVNLHVGNVTEFQDKIDVVNKADGQFVIINFLDADGDLGIKRMTINNTNSASLKDCDIAQTVIMNAVDVKGKVKIAELCGIVVAPDSDVELENTCNGRVIAKTFVNSNGQMHFISDAYEQETTQAESESADVNESQSDNNEESIQESIRESQEESERESIKESQAESERESIKESQAVSERESIKESQAESERESIKESQAESERESIKESQAESERESIKESQAESERESIKESQAESERESIKESQAESERESIRESQAESERESIKESQAESERESIKESSVTNGSNGGNDSNISGSNASSGTGSSSGTGITSGSNISNSSNNTGSSDSTRLIAGGRAEVAADEELVVAGDPETKGDSPEVAADEELVTTGDNSHAGIYVVILAAAVIAFGAVVVINKKKSDK